MARGLISYINHVDRSGAVISTDSEIATLPAVNVADPVVQRIWRTSATSAYLQIDFGAPVQGGLLLFDGTTLAGTDSIRHRLSAVAMGDGELLDVTIPSGVVAGIGQHVYVLPADVSARHWRCDIAAAAPFDIGRAWFGPTWRFARNYSWGAGEDETDLSTVTRAERSGVTFVDIGPTIRSWDFSTEFMTEADSAQSIEMIRTVGRRKQLVFVPDHESADAPRKTILGKVVDKGPLTWSARDIFARRYRIEQDR